jgi:iron complex outermembrane recepter protein
MQNRLFRLPRPSLQHLLLGSMALTTALPGFAQDGPLQEMVITATRQEQELRNIPASVSVISRDDIQLGQQQLSLAETLGQVPGLFAQNQYNFTQDLRVSIRGAGSRASFGIRGIQIYIDGIPATTTDGQGGVDDVDLGSAERVEVIRGPVSSLYGSASGGVINIMTEAGPDQPFVEISTSQGEYQASKYQLKTGGQTGDLNYLVNVSRLTLDGYRDNSAVEHNMLNSRFDYDLSPDSDLLVILNLVDSPWAEDGGSITAAMAAADPRQAWPANITYDSGEGLNQQRLGLVYTRDLSETQKLTVRNFYLWREFSTNLPFESEGVSSFDRFFYGGGIKYDQIGTLFGKPNQVTVGIDASAQSDDRTRYDNQQGTRGPLTQDQNEHAEGLGLYVRNDLQITERLNLVLGGRYDKLNLAIDDNFLTNADQSGSLDFNQFSPMVGVTYALTTNVRLYSKYGTAFETPTFTEIAGPGGDLGDSGISLSGFTDVKAQQARSIEMGLRGTTLAQRLEFDLVVYAMTVKDEVVNTATLGSRGVFENADTDRQGFEAMGVLTISDTLELTGSYTYSDFSFDKFPSNTAAEGNDLPLIPENQLFTQLKYHRDSGLFVVLDYHWVDSYFANNANTASNDAFGVSNLRMGKSFKSNNLSIDPYLGVKNLTDESYNDNVRPNAFGGRFYEPAPGRNVYAGANLRYDF